MAAFEDKSKFGVLSKLGELGTKWQICQEMRSDACWDKKKYQLYTYDGSLFQRHHYHCVVTLLQKYSCPHRSRHSGHPGSTYLLGVWVTRASATIWEAHLSEPPR